MLPLSGTGPTGSTPPGRGWRRTAGKCLPRCLPRSAGKCGRHPLPGRRSNPALLLPLPGPSWLLPGQALVRRHRLRALHQHWQLSGGWMGAVAAGYMLHSSPGCCMPARGSTNRAPRKPLNKSTASRPHQALERAPPACQPLPAWGPPHPRTAPGSCCHPQTRKSPSKLHTPPRVHSRCSPGTALTACLQEDGPAAGRNASPICKGRTAGSRQRHAAAACTIVPRWRTREVH